MTHLGRFFLLVFEVTISVILNRYTIYREGEIKMKNYFKSIGGGNEIGASSYYVYCNGKNFLFDAGIRLSLIHI